MRRNIIADCLLCGAANEVRDHLFSQSLYSKSVRGNKLLKSWNATIYGIWKQRNVKVHGTADISSCIREMDLDVSPL
ncbi:hypothetical protein NC652_010341 [Populus alba x Populus x berolinensis]|nr:hypothetical protein NC652_010341 [Populus alba x Populus x berolinensis]